MDEPNYEYEAQLGDYVLFEGQEAVVIEVDEDIYDAKIKLGNKEFWVKQSQLKLIRR